jgi:ubiquinone/menaquinone biosynthesis C-methylase UbiE
VGCGSGEGLLTTFEEFGIERSDISAIDLSSERTAACSARFGGADIRVGDAGSLPWEDEMFDIVFQATVFTSILDQDAKQQVAKEMLRVLKPAGCIVWYDFIWDNPRNNQVKGIKLSELRTLFPETSICAKRITLAPPLARKIVPFSWSLASMLERLVVLNTHYMALVYRVPQFKHDSGLHLCR